MNGWPSLSDRMLELNPVEPVGVVAKWCVCLCVCVCVCVCARARARGARCPALWTMRARAWGGRCGLVLRLIGGAAAENLDTVCWTARGRGEMRGHGMGRGGGRGDTDAGGAVKLRVRRKRGGEARGRI